MLGTIGLASVFASMTLGARSADPVLAGRRVTIIRGQTILAIAGVPLFVFSPSTPLALVGVLLSGVGASLGTAWHERRRRPDRRRGARQRRGLDRLLCLLGGPPLTGYLGQNITIRKALVAVAVAVGLATLVTGSLRPLPDEERRDT